MEDAIVDKLRKHLASSIDTECKVVYLLCEVRKLLDKQPPDPTLFALRLNCHWALHVNLSRPLTTKHFLEKVDGYVFDKLNAGDTEEVLAAEHALFQEFVYLETFRNELSQFLRMHALPTSLCDEDKRWFDFLAAYAGVIEDGSLTCQSKDPDKLRIVAKVTFTKSTRKTAGGHLPFDVKWDIRLKDTRRVEIEAGTQVNHKLMHWTVRLVGA